jgi:hypothetical protein
MAYNYRSIVNHVLRKTEFAPVSETVDSQFTGSTVDPFVDRIKDWTNEVYLDICNSGYWRFLESSASFNTVIGQESYSLANDCLPDRIISIRETSTPAILYRTDFKLIDVTQPDTSTMTNNTPISYYFFKNNLYLYPVPNSVITIRYRYYKIVTELVNPTDVPAIPEQWKWVLVNGILVRANQYLQDQNIGDSQIQYYNGLIQMRSANRADRQHFNTMKPF